MVQVTTTSSWGSACLTSDYHCPVHLSWCLMQLKRFFHMVTIGLALFSTAVCADTVEYVVSGVDEPMLSNVRDHVTAFRVGSSARLSARLRRNLTEDTINAATAAMRPYGYFHPVVDIEIIPKEEFAWLVTVNVEAGPPVLVEDLQLQLAGPGKDLATLNTWYAEVPLTPGKILNQPD